MEYFVLSITFVFLFLFFCFYDFDLGAPVVPKETTKLPMDGQGTPNGRPKVHKGLKRVWKWSPKVAKSLTISSKRLCSDTNIGHEHNDNTKTHNVNKDTNKQTKKQTNKQTRKQANKQATNKHKTKG